MNPETSATQHEDTVRAAWIDDNDHMNLAYYLLVFEDALDALRTRVAPGVPLRLLEMHTVYEREVRLGDTLRVTTHILAVEASRVRLFQEMFGGPDGVRAATFESVALLDGDVPRATLDRLQSLIPRAVPDGAGRRIALPTPRP